MISLSSNSNLTVILQWILFVSIIYEYNVGLNLLTILNERYKKGNIKTKFLKKTYKF